MYIRHGRWGMKLNNQPYFKLLVLPNMIISWYPLWNWMYMPYTLSGIKNRFSTVTHTQIYYTKIVKFSFLPFLKINNDFFSNLTSVLNILTKNSASSMFCHFFVGQTFFLFLFTHAQNRKLVPERSMRTNQKIPLIKSS